jgi:hypothetical protein
VTAVLATRRMMAVYLESANAARAGSLLVLLMGAYEYLLVVGNWALAYPYDLPQLALFSCALMHLVRGEAFYYLFFVLACLNRETALFLVVIHGLFRLGPDLDAALIAREPGGLRRLAAGCRC